MEKIGIIGQGFVGTAVREGMKNYFQILAFDKDPNKYTTPGIGSILDIVSHSDATFLCVPTPMKKTGECDLSILNRALTEISDCVDNLKKDNFLVIIKSTIPPGTTDSLSEVYKKLNIVFNPEFLTEANSIEDYKNQNRIIIGGNRPGSTRARAIMAKAFPKVPIIKTSSTIAETVKYLTNTFLATKVAFANEVYQICEALNIDYDKVVEYARYDARLGNSHWSVPGPDGDLGFGGHCMPGNFTIKTTGGSISLKSTYKKFSEGKTIECISFDDKLKNRDIKKITLATKNFYEGELITFELDDYKLLTSTPEHIYPINRNGQLVLSRAIDISTGDKFYTSVQDAKDLAECNFTNLIGFRNVNIQLYKGNVYNLELESKILADDLFWVEGFTNVITHNCFPKDIAALKWTSEQLGVDATMLSATINKNNSIRKNRDWETQKGRAVSDDE